MTLRALDLFCGAGGASMGLHRAGFEVVGIDHRQQPRYPFTFIQADALRPPVRLEDFALIWASPPCQGYSRLRHLPWLRDREYPLLIDPVRDMLRQAGRALCDRERRGRADLWLHVVRTIVRLAALPSPQV
jgi:DNA (cytosine-5)-methyltransferase 1